MSADALNPQQFAFHEALQVSEPWGQGKTAPFPGLEDVPAWKVKEVPVSSVIEANGRASAREGWEDADWEDARSYSKNIENSPPILLGRGRKIYDGNHRVEAHLIAGRKTIKAFVPVDEE